jgi:hypothetical protein
LKMIWRVGRRIEERPCVVSRDCGWKGAGDSVSECEFMLMLWNDRRSAGGARRPPSNRRHSAVRLAWAAIAAGICAAMAPLEPSLLEEGLILHLAQRMVGEERLFADLASFTGPFPFELLALLFCLFGEEIAVARAAVAVFSGISCASVFALARRAGHPLTLSRRSSPVSRSFSFRFTPPISIRRSRITWS